jgi:amidohydrolase
MKDALRGTVVFIFQPAEESVPAAERPAGANLMVKEGVLRDPKVDAIFGLHVFSNIPSGRVSWRSGPMMAAADAFEVTIRGKQTHGAGAIQTIVSRQVDITAQPAIVTIGQFDAGVRNNIIPDSARLVGTIRTFDADMRRDIQSRLQRMVGSIAEASGASAEVTIDPGYPVTVNNPALSERMLPTLKRVLGDRVYEGPKITGAEDFSYFQQQVPGVFLLLGVTPQADVGKAAQNHSPKFFVDESALLTGVRTLVHLTLDYQNSGPGK